MKNIVFVCGSLRNGSYNRIYMETMIQHVPEDWSIKEVSFKDVPLYNFDLEGEQEPQAVTEFRDALSEADGIIIVTPEYNTGVPGPLKNAIDWASRVKNKGDKSPLVDRPFAIAGCSPGATGSALSQAQLRQTLTAMNAHIMPGPKLIIGKVHELITPEQTIEDARTISYMKRFVDAFDVYIDRLN
ncbi:FMN-dependent NADPH-azoreductase [Macrococcoides canis]|uniref:FMN-dependent NADPH-azoreductase n=1 Tax=Macrococcoides canis TaxID=1855823 RepID=A0A1W7A8E5_9STAP|nr:NADPH-dependent FMN reductase [Macrococcus canis]ARQ05784.1 NADPH azoreductase [Macrococcus canis]